MRLVAMQDVDDVFDIFGDPEAVRAYADTKDLSGCAEWIQRILDRYERHGHGLWAVVLADTGENIGQCGLSTQPFLGDDELGLGWLFKRKHWGNGYATEAAVACRDYAREHAMARALTSYIRPNNTRSIAVAKRVGMDCVANLPATESGVFGEPMSVYSLTLEVARQSDAGDS